MVDRDAVLKLVEELKGKAGVRPAKVRGQLAVASVLDEIRAGKPVVWRRPVQWAGEDYQVGDYVDLTEAYTEGGKLANYIDTYIENGYLMTARACESEGGQVAALKDFIAQDLEPILAVFKELERDLPQHRARVELLTGSLRAAKGDVGDTERNIKSTLAELERVAKGGREAAAWFFDAEKRERERSKNRELQGLRREAARLERQEGLSPEDALEAARASIAKRGRSRLV